MPATPLERDLVHSFEALDRPFLLQEHVLLHAIGAYSFGFTPLIVPGVERQPFRAIKPLAHGIVDLVELVFVGQGL